MFQATVGLSQNLSSLVGRQGELHLTSDTDKVVVHDGKTKGGLQLANVKQGSGVPTTKPDHIGQFYVNTSSRTLFISVGTASAASWVEVKGNTSGGGGWLPTGDTGLVGPNDIENEAITDALIAASAITTNKIAPAAVTAPAIAPISIDGSKLQNNIIGTQHVIAGAITANEIASNTITANEIAANTLTANEIAGETITANELAANTITGDKIAGNTITGSLIQANTITAANLVAGTLTSASGVFGDISVSDLAAGNITVNGIYLGTGSQFLIDGVTKRISIDDNQTTPVRRVNLGQIAVGDSDWGIEIFDASGNLILGTSGLGNGVVAASNILANTITANEIAVGTITANEIAAGTITANELAANTITGNEIAAATITGANIVTGSLSGNLIQAGTITGDKLVAGTITANEIGANEILGSNIAGNTITANKLNVSNLAAISANLGTITAGDISALNISADQITAGILSGREIRSAANAGNAGGIIIGSGNDTALQIINPQGAVIAEFGQGTATTSGEQCWIANALWADNLIGRSQVTLANGAKLAYAGTDLTSGSTWIRGVDTDQPVVAAAFRLNGEQFINSSGSNVAYRNEQGNGSHVFYDKRGNILMMLDDRYESGANNNSMRLWLGGSMKRVFVDSGGYVRAA